MNHFYTRRKFLLSTAASAVTVALPAAAISGTGSSPSPVTPDLNKNPLKIGLMTYTLGKEWDIETIIKNCNESTGNRWRRFCRDGPGQQTCRIGI